MKKYTVFAAVLSVLALSGCEQQPAVAPQPPVVVTVPGPAGPAGPQGAAGVPAEKGETGATGSSGMTGPEGAKGEQGKQGGGTIVVVPPPASQR